MRDRTPLPSRGWVKLFLVACTLIAGVIVYLNVRGPQPAQKDPRLGNDTYRRLGNSRTRRALERQSAAGTDQANGSQ